MPEIFDLFSQADVPIARSRGGLGIGLTLARTLVHLHGGTITARSAGLGTGSEFEVTLPALEASSILHATDEDYVESVDGKAPAKAKTVQKILVIEDSPDVQEMLKDLLEVWGHEVVCASEGLAGVAAALDFHPDMALVDIGLPGIDGFDVARRIRQADRDKELVLVAMTGYSSVEQKAKVVQAGFDLHLVKPVNARRLALVLEQQARAKC